MDGFWSRPISTGDARRLYDGDGGASTRSTVRTDMSGLFSSPPGLGRTLRSTTSPSQPTTARERPMTMRVLAGRAVY